MTFTIEQLEALKEGTTPGPWGWHNNVYDPDERFLHSHNGSMCLSVDDVGSSYFEGDPVLMAAAPALVDALIAEKKAHQKLRKRIEERIRELKAPLCSHMPEGDELDDYLEQWGRQSYEAEMLTDILEGNE